MAKEHPSSATKPYACTGPRRPSSEETSHGHLLSRQGKLVSGAESFRHCSNSVLPEAEEILPTHSRGWQGPLGVTWTNSSAQEGTPRVGHLGGFWRSPRRLPRLFGQPVPHHPPGTLLPPASSWPPSHLPEPADFLLRSPLCPQKAGELWALHAQGTSSYPILPNGSSQTTAVTS